jgi:hypothetical protein
MFNLSRGCVAGVAGLRLLVHHLPDVPLVRGEHYLPVLVEHPDLLQALLTAQHLDHLVEILPLIFKHVIAGASPHRLGDPQGSPQYLIRKLLLLGGDVNVGVDADGHEQNAAHHQNQLQADAFRPHGRS